MNEKNLFQKINEVKVELLTANLKKSWKNKFAGYEYFELSDFLPFIVKACNKIWLFTRVSFTEEVATLKVVNCENPAQFIEITSPMKELELKGCNQIQALWGVETYQRRYLYMSLFDIVENDMFDSTTTEEKKVEIKKVNPEKSKQHLEAFKKACETLDTGDKQAVEDLLWKGRLLLPILQEEDKKELTEICVGIKELLDAKKEKKWQ